MLTLSAIKKCNMPVELPVFLIFFTMMLSGPINMNFVIYRTCYVTMERNESACAQLGLNTTDNSTNELEKEVQAVANYINIVIELFTLIVPCALCLFVGPYSDKKGRRRILIISLAGFGCSYGIKTVISAVPNLSPWYLFLQSIPIMLTGGMPTFIMIAFCYLVDVTTPENRGFRMGIFEAALGLGLLSGMFLSAPAFALIGYTGLFLLCTSLIGFSWLLTVIFLKETIHPVENVDVKFFTFEHIREMWQVTFKPRDGYNRFILLGCIVALLVFIAAENSAGTEGLLLRAQFHWQLERLTNFAGIRSIISIIGTFSCIFVLNKLLGVSESPLIIAGLLFSAAGTLVVAFAHYDWQIYLAAGLRIMCGVVGPMIRSLTSKIVPQNETGKLFAFVICLESFVSIMAGPLYTVLYTNTIDSFPGAFALVPVLFYIPNICFFVYVMILTKRPDVIVYLKNENESKETK